jgi:hypothetical protein
MIFFSVKRDGKMRFTRDEHRGERTLAKGIDSYEERLEKELKPKLTDEFLETLAKAVKVCGWSVDHVESEDFAKWCFAVAGREPPNLDPIEE